PPVVLSADWAFEADEVLLRGRGNRFHCATWKEPGKNRLLKAEFVLARRVCRGQQTERGFNGTTRSMYTVPKLEGYSAEALYNAEGDLLRALDTDIFNLENTEQAWKIIRDKWLSRKSGLLTQINDK